MKIKAVHASEHEALTSPLQHLLLLTPSESFGRIADSLMEKIATS